MIYRCKAVHEQHRRLARPRRASVRRESGRDTGGTAHLRALRPRCPASRDLPGFGALAARRWNRRRRAVAVDRQTRVVRHDQERVRRSASRRATPAAPMSHAMWVSALRRSIRATDAVATAAGMIAGQQMRRAALRMLERKRRRLGSIEPAHWAAGSCTCAWLLMFPRRRRHSPRIGQASGVAMASLT